LRNIFLFIRQHFNLLLFLFLQIFSIYLIVSYSKYHNAVFAESFNKVTGKINSRYSNINQYFHLKKMNDSLIRVNENLYNKLKSDFSIPDSATQLQIDSLKLDSFSTFKKYSYLSARVVSNSVTNQINYIVLDRGKKDNLKEGMGIIDPYGNAVGIIVGVNQDYAIVMSLLHKDSHISGKLYKTGETGTLLWDGKDPETLILSGISKSAKICKGDMIITSGFSTAFPLGIKIGSVTKVYNEKANNNFKIFCKSATNFYNLTYVYIIQNKDQDGVTAMLEKVKGQQ
jgi:rod shape-determining protein MreC